MEKEELEEKIENGAIQCRIIIEILGNPKEHVENTIKIVLKKLEEEKDVDLTSYDLHPAKEQDDKMFSSYAETEVLFKNFETLTRITFDYMPSSVEILKPSEFKIPSLEISNFVSDTLSLLHQIDFKLKDTNAKNMLLEKNSNNLLKNLITSALSNGNKSTSQLSKIAGIKPEQLDHFLTAFAQENLIRKKGDLWENLKPF